MVRERSRVRISAAAPFQRINQALKNWPAYCNGASESHRGQTLSRQSTLYRLKIDSIHPFRFTRPPHSARSAKRRMSPFKGVEIVDTPGARIPRSLGRTPWKPLSERSVRRSFTPFQVSVREAAVCGTRSFTIHNATPHIGEFAHAACVQVPPCAKRHGSQRIPGQGTRLRWEFTPAAATRASSGRRRMRRATLECLPGEASNAVRHVQQSMIPAFGEQ